ncbi:unnamed protein product, partial [Polarella glacialis]
MAHHSRFVRAFSSGLRKKLLAAQSKILVGDGAGSFPDRAKLFRWPQQPSAALGAACGERLHHPAKCVWLALQLRKSSISGSHPDIRLVSKVEDACLESIDKFKCAHLSMLATASADVFPGRDLLWLKLAVAAQREHGSFNGNQLANILRSFARTGRYNHDLFTALSRSAQRIHASLSTQNIANLAWAFATIGSDDRALFRALSMSALQKIGEFTSTGLSNLVWAFASVAWSGPELFDAVAKEAMPRISEFNEQGFAMTAWAFAKAGLKHTDSVLFHDLAA